MLSCHVYVELSSIYHFNYFSVTVIAIRLCESITEDLKKSTDGHKVWSFMQHAVYCITEAATYTYNMCIRSTSGYITCYYSCEWKMQAQTEEL